MSPFTYSFCGLFPYLDVVVEWVCTSQYMQITQSHMQIKDGGHFPTVCGVGRVGIDTVNNSE